MYFPRKIHLYYNNNKQCLQEFYSTLFSDSIISIFLSEKYMTALTMTANIAVTAALIDSEVFSIDDVARMLNIPPHMLAEMSHSTFSNIEHQTIQFVQYPLRPIVKRLEVELETKLFSRSDADVKFILDGLLRGDTAARTAYYHQAVLDGWLTRNEAREMEGFEKKEGLDTFLYPQNEGMVGDDNNENI